MKRRFLALFLALAMCCALIVPGGAAGEAEATVKLDLADGSIVIAADGNGNTTYTQGETVTTGGNVCVIRQKDSGTTPTANTITVSGGEIDMTLAGVNIETTAERSHPISVAKNAHLQIKLVGENTAKVTGDYAAGIHVPEGARLTVGGNGSLDATGGRRSAGIGGASNKGFSADSYENGGIIIINNGTVTAVGGGDEVYHDGGAGIGGGYNGDGGTITINGGVITAVGGDWSAGIGGGTHGNSGNITINGGTVVANGSEYAAGIGAGRLADGEKITVTGGEVTATGGKSGGAGIGGGSAANYSGDRNYGNGGLIVISGGTVTAVCGGSGMYDRAAGIGGGSYGNGGTVSISNATVTAEGYYHAIGGGDLPNEYGCDSITIGKNATLDLSYTDDEGSLYQERIFDLDLPASAAALAGNTPLLETAAHGASGLEYQWQISPDGSAWTDIDGEDAAAFGAPMTAETDRHYFRCRLTNGFGNVVYTDPAQCYVLAFSKQPENLSVGAGDVIALEAQSTCNQVTYRWERSYDDGGSWQDVPDVTYATLLLDADLNENNALYRCVITATNGDELPSEAARITVTTDKPTYTTQYWLQEANGEDYTLAAQTVLEGTAGASVTAPTKTFEGYTENAELGVHSGSVKADSSLILSRYYDRNFYTITFEVNGGSAVAPMEARFGARIKEPSAPSRYGYTFDGWYADEALTEEYEFTTMPMGGTTVYAKWKALDEDRGIEYRFNGITIRDPETYETLNAIPDGNFYAEVSVTNLKSKTTDSLVVASYDKDGRMLDIDFLYANPGVGDTVVFGALIRNSGEVASIKAFMLAALNGLRPLAVNAVYPAPDGWYEPQPGEPGEPETVNGVVLGYNHLSTNATDFGELEAIMDNGFLGTLDIVELDGMTAGDYYASGYSSIPVPAFYAYTAVGEAETHLASVTENFDSYGIYVVTIDREIGLDDYIVDGSGRYFNYTADTIICDIDVKTRYNSLTTVDAYNEKLTLELGESYIVVSDGKGDIAYAVLVDEATEALAALIKADT